MQFYWQKLKDLRKTSKVSVNFIMKKMEISRKTYWLWENGKRIPSESNIRTLAGILDLKVSQISDLKAELPVSKDSINKAFLECFSSSDRICGNIIQSVCKLSDQLKQSQTIANALLSSIKVIFYIKDVNLEYIMVNDYFKEIYSLPEDYNCIGKNDASFFSRKEAEENTTEDNIVLQTRVRVHSREAYMPGTRKSKWALISKNPILDSESKITGIVGTFIDITDSKEDRTTNMILKQAIDQIKECVWIGFIKDNSVELKYINNSVENLTGFTKEEVLYNRNTHQKSILPEDTEKFNTFRKSRTYPKSIDYRVRRRTDGKLLTLKETIYSDGNIKFGIITDITEQKTRKNE